MYRCTLLLLLLLLRDAAAAAAAAAAAGGPPSLPILGIDLGNVYSTVGVYVDGRVEMIADEQGRRLTPSLVAFTAAGQLVGHAARDQAHENPTNTIYESKRFIGRRYSDAFVHARGFCCRSRSLTLGTASWASRSRSKASARSLRSRRSAPWCWVS